MKQIENNMEDVIDSIEYKTQLIGRNQRLIMAVEKTRLKGILLGFILTLIIVGLPILYYKGGF